MPRVGVRPRGPFIASLTIFFGATVWGLYWLPLREAGRLGLSGPWSVVAFNAAPLAVLLPLVVWRRAELRRHWRMALAIGFFSGAGLACYELGLLYTTILRATLLYYLTPIWSTLIAMALIGERVTWHRVAAICLGLAGLALMLGLGGRGADGQATSLLGDSLGLLSGMLWGFGATFLRRHPEISPLESVPMQYLFGALAALAAVWLGAGPEASLPALGSWLAAAPITTLFTVGLIMPTVFAIFWAAQIISPGRVGLLMMSEVVVAGLSASLIAGERITLPEGLGAGLILAASAVEIFGPTETVGE